jgi:dynamin family protein
MSTKIELIYNPYTVETKFKVNGADGIDESITNITRGKRLQIWIDKILEKLFKKYNTRDVDFEFTGTVLDAEDVKDAVCSFNKTNTPMSIKLICNENSESIDDKTRKLKELYKKAQDGPFEEFKSPQMKYNFESALAPEFEVNVIATMSSGKSTVINAMLGKELMPAKNEACTATIARIEDHDDMTDFQACRFNKKQEKINDWQVVNSKLKGEKSTLLEDWNNDEDTSVIEIKGDIPAIDEREGVRMVLVDTPGPNNSRDASHKAVTVKAIKEKQLSMVLYILNATQLSTDDDSTLLNLIRDTMSSGGREAQDRFIFIANKIDSFDPETGESVAGALENVRNYLKENGIKNPLVIPASAELTKLIRINKFEGKEGLSRKQRGDLNNFVELFIEEEEMNMLKHVKNSVSNGTYNKLSNKLKEAQNNENEHKEAEILSGIPIVEALLDNFISKHAIPAKIKDAVDSFSTVIAEAEGIKKLDDMINQDEAAIVKLSQNIEDFKNNQGRIDEAKRFRDKVKNETYKISDDAKKERRGIDFKIKDLLDEQQERFEDEVTPSRAKSIFSSAQRNCEFLFEDIQVILEKSLKIEFSDKMNSLRDEYQIYIKDLLDKSFPDSDNVSLKEFQASAMKMPDTNSLIRKSTYEKKTKVCVGTERHGFLWLKKRNVYETTYEDRVDMSEPFEELANSIRENKIKKFQEFEKLAKENVEQAKNILLSSMDEIDNKMDALQKDMQSASKNKAQKEKMIKANKEKLIWFNEFKKELDQILAI